MRILAIMVLFTLVLGLAACGGNGGGGEATPPAGGGGQGDPAAGEALFTQATIGSAAGCTSCHSLEPGTTLVGPSLAGIGAAAATRVSGQSAEQYLRESIVAPDAHVVEGFPAGVMPKTYDQELSDQQLNDLVAFLLSR